MSTYFHCLDCSGDSNPLDNHCPFCGSAALEEVEDDPEYNAMMQELQSDIAYGPSLGEYVTFRDEDDLPF